MVNVRRGAGWLGVGGFGLALLGGSPAYAQVKQTDVVQTPLPQPVGAAELNIVNNAWAWNAQAMINRDATGANLNPPVKYGDYYAPPNYPQFATGDAITLSGLFKWRKEAIDPVLDAKTAPGYFLPKTGFRGQLLLMGGNCQMLFGWYNVLNIESKVPPTTAEIYPFVDQGATSLKCVESDGVTQKKDGFCPLAWDNRHPYDLSIFRWTPKVFESGDLSNDPRYKGGFIAFAVIGAATRCTQSKFSMYEHNQRNAAGVPWVAALIYRSTVDTSGFYMAFEDVGMPAADWKQSGADGDFNDLVYYVSGLELPNGSGGTVGTGGTGGVGGSATGGTGGGGSVGGGGTAGALSSAAGLAGEAEDGAAGAAGLVTEAGAAGAENAAGEANASGGSAAHGGASTTGGGSASGSASSGSSSCSFGASGTNTSQRARPILGLLFGLAFARRLFRRRSA